MDQTAKEIMECVRNMAGFIKGRKSPHFMGTGMKDLTLSQLDLMAYLYEHKRAKMSDLAKHTGVKMPSMTETVNKLVSLGVLKREHDEKDRRTVWVSVNKDVEKMVCGHIKQKETWVSNIMEALTPQEKKQALNILKKIQSKMERE